MPSYLLQASYTSEALAALVKNPQNRTEIIRKTVKNLGGKLIGSVAVLRRPGRCVDRRFSRQRQRRRNGFGRRRRLSEEHEDYAAVHD